MQRTISFTTLALALVYPAAGLAQQRDAEAPVLGEVRVEAERSRSFRSETVQVGTFRDMRQLDVPLTANVVTRPVMEAQAATGLYDALRNTAGVTRSQLNGATYDNIAIRGILVENRGNYRLNGSLPVVNLIDLPLEKGARRGPEGRLVAVLRLHSALGRDQHGHEARGARSRIHGSSVAEPVRRRNDPWRSRPPVR